MTELPAPSINQVELSAVLAALADPLRRRVVTDLMARPHGEHPCSSFELPVAKSTRTHHWRALRQAGLIHQRDVGNGSTVRLRRSEMARRFPGLLDSIVAAEQSSRRPARHGRVTPQNRA